MACDFNRSAFGATTMPRKAKRPVPTTQRQEPTLAPPREEQPPPPGFTLRHTLQGHEGMINRIAWSPDGRMLASPSFDKTLRIWDAETGDMLAVLREQGSEAYSVAWLPDGRTLVSGGKRHGIRLWDMNTWKEIATLETTEAIYSVAWSPDERIALGGKVVQIWDARTRQVLRTWNVQQGTIYDLAWSTNGLLALGVIGANGKIRLWDTMSEEPLEIASPHNHYVISVAWSPDDRLLASGGGEGSIQLWDVIAQRRIIVLEGHTNAVLSLSFSSDGRLLASKSSDNTVRLWRTDAWLEIARLSESYSSYFITGLAFHPTDPTALATLGEGTHGPDTVIRIWDLDLDELLGGEPATESIKYTTAKIALVGDSGVGKTGLGWRLAHGEFKEQASTHGQQFWVINELGATRADGTECAAVLWDLAGQPDYRLVHALFLDDVDQALVLFDPANRQEPLKGVEYWLKQLAHRKDKARPCGTILVGARADRGTPTMTQEEIAAFCRRYAIAGGYIGTSALNGAGLPELIERIKAMIDWDAMPATVTTATFKRIKEYVLALKADPQRKGVLVSPVELRARLEATDPAWSFDDAEMSTAVGHLANHGYVSVLRNSRGEQTFLLAPDLLVNLASSIVLEARRNPKGLGALEEARLLQGGYSFPELAGLEQRERDVLLDAAAALFLKHMLCFRETLGVQTFLVFPALINQKRPLLEEIPTTDDISYEVVGAVENVYAALVALLGYSNTFTRTNQWQNQAQYETARGEVCGFRQLAEREGAIELVLYYGTKTAESMPLLFQGLFEQFLRGRDVTITRYPPVRCPKCKYQQPRAEVVSRIRDSKGFTHCSECGKKIPLPKAGEPVALSQRDREQVDQEQAHTHQRVTFEAALVRIKALVRDRGRTDRTPSCFMSYAWGDHAQERWVGGLATDLENAGVAVILDQRDNARIGASIGRFISRLEEQASDFVVVVGTPLYRRKYENKLATTGSVVAAEVDLINLRLMGTEDAKNTVLPLLLDGEERDALPPLLRGRVYADFRQEEQYFAMLFDLILTLHSIPVAHPAIADLRDSLRDEAERVW